MKLVHALSVIHKSIVVESSEVREFCTIRDSKISKGCHISERVSIKKSNLGAGVEVNAGTYIENATFEKNVQIGPNCSIVGVTHNFSAQGVDKNDIFREIKIAEGVWVAANCVVLPGVVIGKHSIVAAGSVVGRNIPDGHIYLGNPSSYKLISLADWKKESENTIKKER